MATEEDFDTILTNSQKNIYKQYHSLENFCLPIFRDAPWVFFAEIALCLELKAPAIKAHELCQRWKLALRAFEKWKAHEFLNFRTTLLSSSSSTNPNHHHRARDISETTKLLLDVVDLEDAADEAEGFGDGGRQKHHQYLRSPSHSSHLTASAYHLFSTHDVSLVATMQLIKKWMQSHGLNSICDEQLSSQLPAVHHIDEIVSHQIQRELTNMLSLNNNNGGRKQKQMTDKNGVTPSTASAAVRLSEKLVLDKQNSQEEVDRAQEQLVRTLHRSTASTNHNQKSISALLLQTAVALRKQQQSGIQVQQNSSSNSSSSNGFPPSFVPNADVWNKVMIERAMKSGSWQHAHFLFLRSLHTLSLQQQCEFVEFELDRTSSDDAPHQKSASSSSVSSSASSFSSSTALQAVAIAIIPTLASAKTSNASRRNSDEYCKEHDDERESQTNIMMSRNDLRNLSFAARVGAQSFLRCGMWRSAIRFATSTLALREGFGGRRVSGSRTSIERVGSVEERKEIATLVAILSQDGRIPWESIASLIDDGDADRDGDRRIENLKKMIDSSK